MTPAERVAAIEALLGAVRQFLGDCGDPKAADADNRLTIAVGLLQGFKPDPRIPQVRPPVCICDPQSPGYVHPHCPRHRSP